jgi:N-acetylglucosaminyldiphosphoundecaprenol N-acetyl-beta-D-mannosaminyltransferase
VTTSASLKVPLQGIPVDALTLPELLSTVERWVEDRERRTVAYVNVHVLNVAAGDAELTAFLQGVDLCYADGKGVVLGAKLVGRELPGRMTGADWIEDLAEMAVEHGWRLGWVGGEYGVTAAAARVLAARHPGLQVVEAPHGYFPRSGPGHDALIARLNDARLDMLLVGMGTPIQERWVAAARAQLEVPVVWCLGATADFISGKVSRGPELLYKNQEWLARLVTDPRRLWKRYLVGNPRFLARMIRERATRDRA